MQDGTLVLVGQGVLLLPLNGVLVHCRLPPGHNSQVPIYTSELFNDLQLQTKLLRHMQSFHSGRGKFCIN